MEKTILCITFVLAGAVGCGTSGASAPPGELAQVIPASEQSARAVPGLVAWKVYQVSGGIETVGVDNQDHVLTRSSIHRTMVDSQGTMMVEIASSVPTNSTLRLTTRDHQVLSHEMIGTPSSATSQMVSDLKAASATIPYSFRCWESTAWVVIDCGFAIGEEGLNPFIDEACLDAVLAWLDDCVILT